MILHSCASVEAYPEGKKRSRNCRAIECKKMTTEITNDLFDEWMLSQLELFNSRGGISVGKETPRKKTEMGNPTVKQEWEDVILWRTGTEFFKVDDAAWNAGYDAVCTQTKSYEYTNDILHVVANVEGCKLRRPEGYVKC